MKITKGYPKRRKDGNKTDEARMMANKTGSKVPQTPKQKKMWIQARRFVARTVGRYGEEDIPWALVQKIYADQEKSGKILSDSDIKNAKPSATIRKYKVGDRATNRHESEMSRLKRQYLG